MKQSHIFYYLIITLFLGLEGVKAQERRLFLPVDSLFALAERNSVQLAASRQKISINEKRTEIEKQEAWLPEIGVGLSAGYISNANIWDKHFNYESTMKMPHISTSFTMEGDITVYSGGRIKNGIEKSELVDEIAILDYQNDKERIQLLLLGKYLQLFTLYNQKTIYNQNIELAEHRLSNIQQLIKQGMLTHNEHIRSSLQITELKLKLTEIENDINITNHDLGVVIGLAENTVINVDTTLYEKAFEDSGIAFEQQDLPEVEAAGKRVKMAEKDLKIAKAARLPQLSLYAENGLARPYLYSVPPMDVYMNLFQTGAKLKYNISGLYHSKKNIEKAHLEIEYAQKQQDWAEQQAEMDRHAALVKMQEAQVKYNSEQESFQLAQDNYRVVEQKYLNKFVAITDMLDASTSLLSSQLNLSNSRVNIIYRWYNLMKATGNWGQTKN